MAGVEGAFDLGVEVAEGRGGGYFPPRLFGEADSVFATDDPAHSENLLEKFVENTVHPAIVRFGSHRSHEVDMNITIPGMAKAGNGNSILLLKAGSTPKEIHNTTPRNGDVLIEFNEARVAQGVTKASANLPDLLASYVAVCIDDLGCGGTKNLSRRREFAFDRGGLAVKLDDEH